MIKKFSNTNIKTEKRDSIGIIGLRSKIQTLGFNFDFLDFDPRFKINK